MSDGGKQEIGTTCFDGLQSWTVGTEGGEFGNPSPPRTVTYRFLVFLYVFMWFPFSARIELANQVAFYLQLISSSRVFYSCFVNFCSICSIFFGLIVRLDGSNLKI